MLRQQAERWWAVALRGLVAVVFGVVTLAWPNLTLAAIILLYGAFALADGVLGIVALLLGRRRPGPRWAQVLDSLLSIAAGLIALLWPGITSLALIWLIAAWALAKGILQVVLGVRLRGQVSRPWLLVLAGVLSLILGVIYVIFPQAGILSLVWVLGVFALLHGVSLIARGFLLRDVDRELGGEAGARA